MFVNSQQNRSMSMLVNNSLSLPLDDLNSIAEDLQTVWPKNKNFFITGGTGFFGRWFVESVYLLESKLKAGNHFYILSRKSRTAILETLPALDADFFTLVQADISALTEKDLNFDIDFVIHGATDVSAFKNQTSPEKKFGDATKNFLQLLKSKKIQRLLYLSSGAVYEGLESPFAESSMTEQLLQSHSNKDYTNEKRASELAVKRSDLSYHILRCFAFVGPYLDESMAVMDMIKHKLRGQDIVVKSPEAQRSYLYPIDLVIQVFRVLYLDTSSTIFNLGSPEAITLENLAQKICVLHGKSTQVKIDKNVEEKALASSIYIPNMEKLYTQLGLTKPRVDLQTALSKTLKFAKEKMA